MSMKKISELQLETTANYQAKSKLNVRFWNQDLNTAELRFLITRDNFPLSLSSENVKVIIALEQGNNFISSEDFEISSEVDGVASFLIPNDFMSAVSGEVTGQVYVGTLDSDEVIVQRKFTFQVENDLLSSIPSELKLQYIKTFSDLRQEVQDRITALENEFVVMEDYVVAVNQATTDGLAALNNLVNAKTIEYNDNHADKLALINTTVDGYVQDFLNQRSYIDTKYAEFQTAVGGSGLVTDADAESWQKYKLTQDDGKVQYLKQGTISNVLDLPTGIYETVSNADGTTQGLPADNTYVQIKVLQMASNAGRKVLEVTSTYNGQKWERLTHTDGSRDTGWMEVAYINPSNPFETTQGSQNKANVAENNAKVYADNKIDEQHNILFSGSINGVGSTVNLTGSMNNYEYIIISGDCSGNDFSQIMVPSIVGSVFNMQNLNLRDSDGLLLGVYECRLETTSTTIKITNDVAYDHPSDTGSGPNRNAYTITRVEGVHKK